MSAVDMLGLVGLTVPPVRFDACVDSGGFGLVYRAHHLSLDTAVAVKALRISNLGKLDDQMRASILGRFRDETKLLYRLSQGNLDIVRCIGSGEVVSPVSHEITPFMILEWLEGHSLNHELKQRREKSERGRTLEEAVALLDSAATAIAYAHSQGVVHRDVKPANLFFSQTPSGIRLKVLDFGLAKIFDDEAIGLRPSVETGVGMAMCSPSYGAPEQFNSNIGPIGPWTDVYSLTLVLLELMKGEKVRPAGNLAEGLLSAIDPERGSPRASAIGVQVSRKVEDLLHRAVAQNPLERPRDLGIFWSGLKELVKQGHMAVTSLDPNVMDAMDQVRAAQAAKAKQQFAGTLMMAGGPPAPGSHVPQASHVPQPAPTPTPETKPMAKTLLHNAGAVGQGASTAPLPPMARPQTVPPNTMAPKIGSQPPAGIATRVAPPRRHGSGRPPPAKSSGGSIVAAILVFVAIVVVGGGGVAAYWYFRLRPH